jgi:hypothetical protein
MKSSLLALLAVVSFAMPALARDGVHLSCSGFMTGPQHDPDNYGIVVDFMEGRASDGESRNETLSMIWAGDLYQATRLNKSDVMGSLSKIILTSKDQKKTLFFKGTYQLLPAAGAQADSKMELKGVLNETPYEKTASNSKVATVLTCVDLSN